MSRNSQHTIKAALELGIRVDTLADVQEVIGLVFELDGLILSESDLGPEFFRLGSGVAGELFQKFVNYRFPVALVLRDVSAHGERFAELAYEHSRHPDIRFFGTEPEARDWLAVRLNRPE